MPSATAQLGFLTPNSACAHLDIPPFLCPPSGWHPEALQTVRCSRCIESRSARRGYENACCSRAHVGAFGVLYGWWLHQGIEQYRSWDRAFTNPRKACLQAHHQTFNPSDSSGKNDDVKDSLQRDQPWPVRCTAVIYELELGCEEDEERVVSERLHHLLHLDSTRRLWNPEVVVTFTSLNFLIVHRHDDQYWDDYLQGTKNRGRGSGSRPRFDLGVRRWEVCGAQDQEGEQRVTDVGSLEDAIESVVKTVSTAGVLSVKVISEERRWRNKSSENIVGRHETWQRRLLRLYFRVRCIVALARTAAIAAATRSSINPLSAIGVGRLMSRRDCDSVLAEAQGSGDWEPWDGDLGEECTTRCLEDLPESRALWEGRAGEAVRARIARTYGVAQSDVSDASTVFVCRASFSDNLRVENEGLDHAKSTQQHHQGGHTVISADFWRSRSLVTFSVQLSAQDVGGPLWAVCFEEQGRCVIPGGQGAGVIFSGKMRHASLGTQFQAAREGESSIEGYSNDTPNNASVVLLRGFADIRGPNVRDGFARGEWGYPPWHVNAPWVKDEEILNRVWVAPTPRVVDEGSRQKRMNTSLAHRYYRQGLGGMNIHLVDHLGRPLVDLHEEGPKKWIPVSWRAESEVKIIAALRRRHAWDLRRRVIGKAGLSTEAGASPSMDAALQELFGDGRRQFEGERVPPIKYVFVDPRYRGFGLGRRLFLEAMCSLARRGFRFVLIVVEDNGSGSLFGFYERMGFVLAEEQLGLPRAMIAQIPPPDSFMAAGK